MEELIEKIEKLKKELDNTEQVQKIKEEIYKNNLYQEYKKSETELNILILQINNELKKINNKGKCGL